MANSAAVTIGVAGHRVLADARAARVSARKSLDHLAAAFGADHMTVMCSLAEGADCIVADEALQRPSSDLAVVLPCGLDDYLKGFTSDAAIAEFRQLLQRASDVTVLDGVGTDAYVAAGLYVLDHADVLLAIWDGEPARGRGGTAEMVTAARARQLPLAWIHTDANATVTYERLPCP